MNLKLFLIKTGRVQSVDIHNLDAHTNVALSRCSGIVVEHSGVVTLAPWQAMRDGAPARTYMIEALTLPAILR